MTKSDKGESKNRMSLGVLINNTAWIRLLGGDETLECDFKFDYK